MCSFHNPRLLRPNSDGRGYICDTVRVKGWRAAARGWRAAARGCNAASCADLSRRIQSSWRNRISSHRAAEFGPQPEPHEHRLFYTIEEEEIEGESGLCVCVCAWGASGQETEEGNHSRITSEGHYVSVKHFSLSETVI